MSGEIVDRLFNSLTVLETAICGAKEALLNKKSVPAEVLARINSYSDILSKQRIVAHEIEGAVKESNWSVVSQKVNIINSLLEMIRQDACEVLKNLDGKTTSDEDEDSEIPEEYIC